MREWTLRILLGQRNALSLPRAFQMTRGTRCRRPETSEKLTQLLVDSCFDRSLEHAHHERKVDLDANFLVAHVDGAFRALGHPFGSFEHDSVALPMPLKIELFFHRSGKDLGALPCLILGKCVPLADVYGGHVPFSPYSNLFTIQ